MRRYQAWLRSVSWLLLLVGGILGPVPAGVGQQPPLPPQEVAPAAGDLRLVATITGPGNRLRFSPDGQLFAIYQQTSGGGFFSMPGPVKGLKIYRTADAAEVLDLAEVLDESSEFHFLREGDYLLVYEVSGGRLFDLKTGKEIPLGAKHTLLSVRLLPDRKSLAVVEFVEDLPNRILLGAPGENAVPPATMRMLDLATGEPIKGPVDTAKPLYQPQVLPNGKYLMGRSVQELPTGEKPPGEFQLWDLATGQTLELPAELREGKAKVIGFWNDGNALLIEPAIKSDGLQQWDVATRKITKAPAWMNMVNSSWYIQLLNGSLDMPFLPPKEVAAKVDGEFLVWDVSTGEVVSQFTYDKPVGIPFDRPDYAANFSSFPSLPLQAHPNGTLTLNGMMLGEHFLTVLEADTLQVKHRIRVDGKPVSIKTSPQAGIAAAILTTHSPIIRRYRGHVIVVDLQSGITLGKFDPNPEHNTTHVAISPDGQRLATATQYPRPRRKELENDKSPLSGHLIDQDDNTRVHNTPWLGDITLWDLKEGKPLRTLATGRVETASLIFSRDGKIVAANIREVRPGRPRSEAWKEGLRGMELAKATEIVVEQSTRVWDVETGKEQYKFLTPKLENTEREVDRFTVLEFTPDGKHLIAAARNGFVVVFDLSTGKHEGFFRLGANAPSLVQCDPTGETVYLFSGGTLLSIALADLRESKSGEKQPKPLARFLTNAGYRGELSYPAAMNPAGTAVVSSGNLHEVHVRDLKPPHYLKQWISPDPIGSVAISADGSLVAVGTESPNTYQLTVLQLSTGKHLATIPDSGSMRVSADGNVVVTRHWRPPYLEQITPFTLNTDDLPVADADHVTFWNTKTGERLHEMPSADWSQMQFAPVGPWLGVSTKTGHEIWDISKLIDRD